MSAARTASWRVLVGAGSFADAEAALQLIDRLDRRRLSELGGLLLEEMLLADLASLPAQRVVTPGGTLKGAPSRRQLGALFEREAAAFRAALSRVAKSRKWAFERRQGELIGGLYEAAHGWDMLFVGHCATHRFPGQVVLIAPPPEASRRAAELAGDLASVLGRGLRVLSLAPKQAATGAHPAAEPEYFENTAALLARLSRLPAAALVVDLAAGPFHGAEGLRQLHEAARCPVVVLGAGENAPVASVMPAG